MSVSSSIDEAVSSSELACDSVRDDKIALPEGDFGGSRRGGVGSLPYFADDLEQAIVHFLECLQQFADFILAFDLDIGIQLTGSHSLGNRYRVAQGRNDTDRQAP